MLELLTVGFDAKPDGGKLGEAGTVTLCFAADRAIRLEIARLACHLGDVGEPWATPWKPAHPVE